MKKIAVLLVFFSVFIGAAVLTGCAPSADAAHTGNAKTVFSSADMFIDKPRREFEAAIANFAPVPEKMSRIDGGYVDITFRLNDGSRITVRFVDTPPDQTVYMIK